MARTYQKLTSIIYRIHMAMIALVCCLYLFHPATVTGEQLKGSEYDVKLGFIYNFINFTTWPESAFEKSGGKLTMCFASNDPSSTVIHKLNGKTIRGRKIKVMAFDAETCLDQTHILFFATQDKVFIKQILDLTKARSILTIGEVEGFTHMGGVVNFFEDRNRLRFQINTDVLRRNGLKMSSQLLGSAQIVKEDND